MEQTLRASTAIKNIKAKPVICAFPFSNRSAANLVEIKSPYSSYLSHFGQLHSYGLYLSVHIQ